jgi:tRNA pseudouridine55 synthase
MRSADKYNGVLAIDKPSGMTSHYAVKRVRHLLKQATVGHTGTLDPLAEGLLLLCVGRGTKITQFVSEFDKTYAAEICLGIRSTTYDAEGLAEDVTPGPIPELTLEQLREALESFCGRTLQTVPVHSSVRVDGRHLYQLARKGEQAVLPVREVEITSIRLDAFESPFVRFEVSCRKGTYIRALANDIGEKLGCGAYLSRLRRTAVGPFKIEQALIFDEIAECAESGVLESKILPIEAVLRFGAVCLKQEAVRGVISGRTPSWADVENVEGEFQPGDNVVVKSPAGEALAVGVAGVWSGEFAARTGRPVASFVRVFS